MAFNMLKMLVNELPETKNKMIQAYHQEKDIKNWEMWYINCMAEQVIAERHYSKKPLKI